MTGQICSSLRPLAALPLTPLLRVFCPCLLCNLLFVCQCSFVIMSARVRYDPSPQHSAHRTPLLESEYFCIFVFFSGSGETKPGAETAAAAGRPCRHIGTPAIVPNQAG